jgi:hypothetical protein
MQLYSGEIVRTMGRTYFNFSVKIKLGLLLCFGFVEKKTANCLQRFSVKYVQSCESPYSLWSLELRNRYHCLR